MCLTTLWPNSFLDLKLKYPQKCFFKIFTNLDLDYNSSSIVLEQFEIYFNTFSPFQGVYAHVPNRDWESNTGNADCADIAHQLLYGETGKNINVILGGGRERFLPNTTIDVEGSSGLRVDGRDLIEEWLNTKAGSKATYIWNRAELLSVDIDNDYLLGLFEAEHMQYYLDVVDDPLEPTLAEMTEVAIKVGFIQICQMIIYPIYYL